MKKVFALAILAITTVFGISAQETATEENPHAAEFKTVLAAMNKQCPVAIGAGEITMTEVVLDGDNVVYCYTLDEGRTMFEAMEARKDMFHDIFLAETLTSPEADTKALLKKARENGMAMIHRFTGSKTGKTFDIVLTAEELK